MQDSSNSELTQREALLIELTHFLSHGDQAHMGLDLKQVFYVLTTPIKNKDGKNAVHCLSKEGRKFLNELLQYLGEESQE